MRIGKNERWILLECLKRHPRPLKKWEVLKDHYGLEPYDERNFHWIRKFKDGWEWEVAERSRFRYKKKIPSLKGNRNKAHVSYVKSRKTLEAKDLIWTDRYFTSANEERIHLTPDGLKKAQSLKVNDSISARKIKNNKIKRLG